MSEGRPKRPPRVEPEVIVKRKPAPPPPPPRDERPRTGWSRDDRPREGAPRDGYGRDDRPPRREGYGPSARSGPPMRSGPPGRSGPPRDGGARPGPGRPLRSDAPRGEGRGRPPFDRGGPPRPSPARDENPLTKENFRQDPQFPRVEAAVAAILETSKVVTVIDVLVKMELLAPEDVERWRAGVVPYLESVVRSRLEALGRLLRVLRFHVFTLKLQPEEGVYERRYGDDVKRLQFTRSGAPKLEEAYSRHFVWPGKGPFKLPKAVPPT